MSKTLSEENIVLYNKKMGGVDRGDQLRGYYSCRTKSRKFYKYLFYFVFDVAVTNAYILHKHFTSIATGNVKEFRIKLAKQLISTYCTRKVPGRSSQAPCILQLQCSQLPAKRGKRGRCAHCSQKYHKRTDCSWKCKECGVWLCHDGNPQTDCFYLWHKSI